MMTMMFLKSEEEGFLIAHYCTLGAEADVRILFLKVGQLLLFSKKISFFSAAIRQNVYVNRVYYCLVIFMPETQTN